VQQVIDPEKRCISDEKLSGMKIEYWCCGKKKYRAAFAPDRFLARIEMAGIIIKGRAIFPEQLRKRVFQW